MSRIYNEADRVCIWLGEATDNDGDADNDDQRALGHVRKIIELQGFESLIHPQFTKQWAALAALMKREWFSRRWVVQEIAFAKEAHVYWGQQNIAWTDLADAVALFGSKADQIAELFKQDKSFSNRGDYLGDVEALGANRLVQTIGKVFRKADNGRRTETLLSLEALISNLSAFNSSRPHDIIYAVLSLARDAGSSAAQPSDAALLPKEGALTVTKLADGHLQARRSSASHRRPSSTVVSVNGDLTGKDDSADNISQQGENEPGSPLSPNISFFDSIPPTQEEAVQQMKSEGFKLEAIEAATERLQKHLESIESPFDYDKLTENLLNKKTKDGRSVPLIGKKYWSYEAIEWIYKGERGFWALLLKLLHRERRLVQGFSEKLLDRTRVKTFYVNYTKHFYEVCREFIDFTIRSSRSLDMLCRPWAPDNDELPKEDAELPSWICPLSNSPFQPRPDGNFGRVNADLLVGMPDAAGRTYTASAGTIPQYWFFGRKGRRNLFVTGLVFAEIEKCATEAVEGNIPDSWIKLAQWHNTKTEQPPEPFWRTIVADRNEKGQNPPSYYERACKYVFGQRTARGSLNLDRVINNNYSQVITDYAKRVQAVVWMRKLIRTKYLDSDSQPPNPNITVTDSTDGMTRTDEQGKTGMEDDAGRLGLAPATAEEGDKICLLRGCSVPVVLREVKRQVTAIEDPDTEEQLQQIRIKSVGNEWKHLTCKLIGECYLHGIMDGEAFKIRVQRGIPDYIFEIE